jgi:hypothetical protein
MKKILFLLVFSSFCFAQQENPILYKNQEKIDEIVQSIEFNGTNLRAEFVKNDVKTTTAVVRKITDEDSAQDPAIHTGDTEYTFYTNADETKNSCNIDRTPEFLYHEGKFIPETISAVWFMTHSCDWPNK